MGTIQSLTKDRMLAIEAASVIDGHVDSGSGHLILTKHDGTTIDAGSVIGPQPALATDAEAVAGTLTTKAVSPSNLGAGLVKVLPNRLKESYNVGSGQNPDSFTTNGFYSGYSWAGSLTGYNLGVLFVQQYSPDWILQDFTNFTSTGLNQIHLRRFRYNGTTWSTWQRVYDTASDVSELGYTTPNPVINGCFMINQRGYVSGAALVPGEFTGFGHDRWRTAGRTNLLNNPVVGTATTNWSATSAGTIARIATGGPNANVPTFVRQTVSNNTFPPGIQLDAQTASINLIQGKTYFASGWVRCSVATTVKLDMVVVDGASAVVFTSTGTTLAIAANTWTRVTVQFDTDKTVWGGVRAIVRLLGQAVIGNAQTYDNTMFTLSEGAGDPGDIAGSLPNMVWVSTAHLSPSVNRSVLTSYSFTQTPQGCLIVLTSGSRIAQIIERGSIPAGTRTFGHSGSGWMRVYNASTVSPPAFAAGPVTVAINGLDDVVIEFDATVGAVTIDAVRSSPGSVLAPFCARTVGEELALCQRYYWRTTVITDARISFGVQLNTTIGETVVPLAVPMRSPALVKFGGGLAWSDGYGFTTAISFIQRRVPPSPTAITLYGQFNAASGAQGRPGFLTTTGSAYLEASAEL